MLRIAVACFIALIIPLHAWSLKVGDVTYRGTDVQAGMIGSIYSVVMQGDTGWFTFNFLSRTTKRPKKALAINLSMMGFEPMLQCDRQTGSGVRLKGSTILGSVECSEPAGTFRIYAVFE